MAGSKYQCLVDAITPSLTDAVGGRPKGITPAALSEEKGSLTISAHGSESIDRRTVNNSASVTVIAGRLSNDVNTDVNIGGSVNAQREGALNPASYAPKPISANSTYQTQADKRGEALKAAVNKGITDCKI